MKFLAKPSPVNYPLALPLRYRGRFEDANITGACQTKWINSKEIAFAACEGMREHMRAEIAIAWPFLLDERVRLQLTIEAVVTSIDEGVAVARISTYQFRTRPAWETMPEAACEATRLSAPVSSAGAPV